MRKPKKIVATVADVGRGDLPKETTAFELAELAALLASRKKPAHECLAEAEKLLQSAQEYLTGRAAGQRKRLSEALVRVLDHEGYSFSELVQPLRDQRGHKGKKPRTPLGEITTPQGLKKAIRRIFPKEKADSIISAKELRHPDLQYLLSYLEWGRASRTATEPPKQTALPPVNE